MLLAPLCVCFLVMYECTFDVFDMSLFVCVCACALTPRAGLSPFPFLSEATWYPDPPPRVLLKQLSVNSTAHRLHERPFILHSAPFFNQHSSFTSLSGQIASFVFVLTQASKPASQQHSTVSLVCLFESFQIVSHFLSPAGFHFALKCVSDAQWGGHTHLLLRPTQTSSTSFIKIGIKTKKLSKASAWHSCFLLFFLYVFQRASPSLPVL